MKKSIKLLSLLLVAILLSLSMASCDSKNNETPTEVPTEVPTESPTEAETEHTEHVGAGKCDVCGLDYFDILMQYIKDNGKTGNPVNLNEDYQITYIWKNQNGSSFCINIGEDGKSIEIQGSPSDYLLDDYKISFTKSTLKYGEWEWEYTSGVYPVYVISGILSPEDISPDVPIHLEIESSNMSPLANKDPYRDRMEDCARKAINDFFIPFLEEVGHDLTPSDFGFVRFEE